MPFYRFEFEVDIPPWLTIMRINKLLISPLRARESMNSPYWGIEDSPYPFVGKIQGNKFRFYPNEQYLSGLILVRGRLVPIDAGTKVSVIIFTHPVWAVLLLLLLSYPLEGSTIIGFYCIYFIYIAITIRRKLKKKIFTGKA